MDTPADLPPDHVPHAVFAAGASRARPAPRVFMAPQRYVQGRGVLANLGRYLAVTGHRRVALVASARVLRGEGTVMRASLAAAGIACIDSPFGGECSLAEVATHVTALRGEGIDGLVAAGGGKCVDAGKAVAHRLGVPVVVVPTLASNDAPCSALSVLYTPTGVSTGVEFYPRSPECVVVDTDVVAAAPVRYLVAGMGDAMATWYEARACQRNPRGVTAAGGRPTLAACTIGEACAHTLFAQGVAAAAAVAAHAVDDALEAVVEANTLLSGVGFESGGLAAAHGYAQSFTALPDVNARHLHGEMVAIGTLAQLQLEGDPAEAARVARFFAAVGLPVHLGQLSLAPTDDAAIATVVDGTLGFAYIGNMPVRVDRDAARAALLAADALGRDVVAGAGDAAWRQLNGEPAR